MLGMIASVLLFVCIYFEKPEWIAVFVRGNLGYSSYFLPFFLLYQSIVSLQKRPQYRDKLFASACFYIAIIVFISASYTPVKENSWYLSGISLNGGGYLGELLSLLLSLGLGDVFAKIVAFLIAVIGFFSISNPAWFRTAIGRSYHTEEDARKNRNILSRLSDYNHYARNSARLMDDPKEGDDVIEIYEETAPASSKSFGFQSSSNSLRSEGSESKYASKYASKNAPAYPHMIDAVPMIGETKLPKRHFAPESPSASPSASPSSSPSSGSAAANFAAVSAKSSSKSHLHSDGRMARTTAEHKNAGEVRQVHTRDDYTRDGHSRDGHSRDGNESIHDGKVRDKGPERKEDRKASRGEEQHSTKKKDGKQYSVPPTQLLDLSTKPKADNSKFISEVVQKLQTVFLNFGVDAKVLSYEEGPTITMFEVVLGQGVKISKLQNLSEDIALNLAAPTVRIAPIEGKSTVGIEVPNSETTAVSMREIIDDREFVARRSPLNVVLGKDISGKPVVADLASMPHLLVAGATGSGKSVCVNAMILSILLNATPEEVRFVMIDPKQVELSNYNDLPHLIMPVVTEAKQAAAALNWTVQEMERRYSLMLEKKVKDYKSYNQKCSSSEKLPYIVVIVDELADLMMVAAKQVEEAICRIAQKARAAGIHLVLATQRPSVDVITGLIKANIPSRIAFSVSSQVDSRTILDSAGAEKLLGKGDMLYHPVSLARAKRVQGAFVSTREIDNVVAFILKQGYQTEQITLDKIQSPDASGTAGGEDEYLEEAIQLVRETRKASASMLQRKFSIGYNRAARLIDIMEEMGVIGPQQGSKSREVL